MRIEQQDLKVLIDALPRHVHQDEPGGGVLRPWVRALPLRFQGVLVSALRGCDGMGKEDDSKQLARQVRRATLNPHDPRESEYGKGFFGFNPDTLLVTLTAFLHSFDQFPLHYVLHLMHACQVIGYMHPQQEFQRFFREVYFRMCHRMHVNPETPQQMTNRLTDDRVAAGTVES